jgi:hypothetical protein
MGDRDAGFSRRTYLGMVGAASGATLLAEPTLATDEYSEVVDIVEAGADNTGNEPIDEVFQEHAEDDTLIEFPDGTYVVNQLIVYQLSNFAMVGKGDATLVPGDNYEEEQWIAGAETRDLTVRNFTLDTTEDGVSPEIDISAYDGLEFRDIVKRGYQDNGGVAIGLRIIDKDGSGLIQNVRAPDGGESVGLYIESDGPMTVRNCQFEEFCDNGVYASASAAPIRVEGGFFRNNNISQVRLGSPDSVVRDAEMVVDKSVTADDNPVNMRGVRVADGPGPVYVENCDISMTGGQGNGGIVNAFSGGSMVVRDTRINVGEEYTTVGSDGSRTSFGIFVDDATEADPGSRTLENVSITGGGTYRAAMLLRRGDNTMDGLCIDQSGEGRNGIILENSSNNTLTDSVIDVSDEEIVLRDSSVRRAGVETSGSCPEPGERLSTSPGEGSGLPGEVGSVAHEQTADGDWHGVGFERTHEAPVVVSKPLSYADETPCHVRLKNVTDDGFDLQHEEWLYLDGDHRPETSHFLTLAAGDHTVDGRPVEAGRVRTDNRFTGFSFDTAFEDRPVVFAQSQTYEGPNPVVTRLRNVTADGAEAMVQEEEGEERGGAHRTETVGYVAVPTGTGTVDGQPFEVGVTSAHEEWRRIDFEQDYEDPKFVAGIQTFHGPNTANLRYRDLSASGVEVHVEEEQSQDEETLHRYERVGYAVFEGA